MNLLLTTANAAAPAGDGAPIGDIALVGGIISAATLAVLAMIVAYRRDGGGPLRAAERVVGRVVHVPGWAAVPSLGAIAAAVLTFMGAIWDIGVHIDQGRDEGPFGTLAHYPLLVGLVLVYLMGLIAVGMAPRDGRSGSRSALPLPGLGPVPVGALLILAGGGFAMLGFPLDDLWHRLFGQDVTLWGPTHTMFFGGLIAASCGAVILRAEGARSVGQEPFGGWGLWRKPLAGVLGGVFLFVGAHATDEFNWAVPQYRQIWHPMLLAFFGAVGLLTARSLGGRGATIAALATFLPLQFAEVLLIGALDTTQPATPLFLVEALLIELVAWRALVTPTVRIGALGGLAVGTIGLAAGYAWSHVAMPLPWQPALLPEAIPVAALAGVAGGILAVLLAQALTGRLAMTRRPLALALGAAALVVGLAVNAGLTSTPPNLTATMTLSNPRTEVAESGEPTRVADLEVRLSRPDLAEDGNWAYVLGWQGGGRYAADLVRQPDGSLRSSRPVPIGGAWKTFVRIHEGRTQVAAPIRMPADAAVGFAGFPAERWVTRPMIRDIELLQIERKDGATWTWTAAMVFVMTLNLSLMALVGAAAVRSGRAATERPSGRARPAAPTPMAPGPREELVTS